ncbi:hypothetical protein MBH78_07925 [Oceanimonas sp. NS1]|nr:hypothetical protein [Oceanimonas sp. NS1]
MNNPLIQDLARLASEGRNPDTLNIDTLSALDIVTLINRQDKGVPEAVARVLPAIAAAVDMIETALRAGAG